MSRVDTSGYNQNPMLLSVYHIFHFTISTRVLRYHTGRTGHELLTSKSSDFFSV